MTKAVTNIAALQDRAIEMANDFVAMGRQMLKHSIAMGGVYTELKAAMPHGEFGAWVEAYSPIGERHVRKLMQLHRDQHLLPKRPSMAVLTINDALTSISKAKGTSRPALPKPAPEPAPEPVAPAPAPAPAPEPAPEVVVPTASSIIDAARAFDIDGVETELADLFSRIGTILGHKATAGLIAKAAGDALVEPVTIDPLAFVGGAYKPERHEVTASSAPGIACVPHALAAVSGCTPEKARDALQTYRRLKNDKSTRKGYYSSEYLSEGLTQYLGFEALKRKVPEGAKVKDLNVGNVSAGNYLLQVPGHLLALHCDGEELTFFDQQMGYWHKLEERKGVAKARNYAGSRVKSLHVIYPWEEGE